jgi:hypothetical protein
MTLSAISLKSVATRMRWMVMPRIYHPASEDPRPLLVESQPISA